MGFRIPRHPEAFTRDKPRKGGRQEEAKHLAFVRSLPCAVCGKRIHVEAAHVRYAEPAYGKTTAGMGVKPDDRWAVPLCAPHHREAPDAQHAGNERAWWLGHRIDPLALAQALHACSGDEEMGEHVVQAARTRGTRR
jgi:hypothetical protein